MISGVMACTNEERHIIPEDSKPVFQSSSTSRIQAAVASWRLSQHKARVWVWEILARLDPRIGSHWGEEPQAWLTYTEMVSSQNASSLVPSSITIHERIPLRGRITRLIR